MGVPPDHPFIDGFSMIFHWKPSIGGTPIYFWIPPFMETPIYVDILCTGNIIQGSFPASELQHQRRGLCVDVAGVLLFPQILEPCAAKRSIMGSSDFLVVETY